MFLVSIFFTFVYSRSSFGEMNGDPLRRIPEVRGMAGFEGFSGPAWEVSDCGVEIPIEGCSPEKVRVDYQKGSAGRVYLHHVNTNSDCGGGLIVSKGHLS